MSLFHQFVYKRVRIGVAAGLVSTSGFFGALGLARTVDDSTIDVGMKEVAAAQKVELPAALMAPAPAPAASEVGAIFDGHIIQAIIAFFESPAGQAILQALIQALIAMLLGGL